MNEKIIEARTRTMTGKGAAKRLRREGRLPAVMYDNTGKAVLLDLNAKDFAKLYGTITESTLIDVKIDGSKDVIAFVKDAQYNIITDTVTHVDFYEVEAGKKIRTKIPVRLTGSPEGVRTGGILEAGTEELDVECLPKNLPPR
ncbi:MAG TPA: 50S ribosomal protein L25, partial [Treponemataceae bacterium]|nr:50S ribosomal protein L25 [Treponemataceae bacterium]